MGTGFGAGGGGGGGGGAAAEAAKEARERSAAARKRGGAEVRRSGDDDDDDDDDDREGRRATPAIDADFIEEGRAAGRTDAFPAAEADVSARSRNVDADDDDDEDEDEEEEEAEERAAPRRRAARDIMATDEQMFSRHGTKGTKRSSIHWFELEFSREGVYPFTDA